MSICSVQDRNKLNNVSFLNGMGGHWCLFVVWGRRPGFVISDISNSLIYVCLSVRASKVY